MNFKKIGLVALLLSHVAISIAQSNRPSGYVLSGTIKGIPDGKVEMTTSNAKTRITTQLNSGSIKNGIFLLKGKLDQPFMVTLTMTPGNWSTTVFVENGNIIVNGDTTRSEHYDYTGYGGIKGATLTQVKISGSKNHDVYAKYDADPIIEKVMTEIKALNKEFTLAKSVEKRNEIREKMQPVAEQIKARQLILLDKISKSDHYMAATAYLLDYYYMMNSSMPLSTIDGFIGNLSGEAVRSTYYTLLNQDIQERKAVMPGNPVEDFTLLKKDSAGFTLSSLRGKYVLIDFWASWCVPCREAIPHWKNVYSKLKGKNFEIVSVTNDSRRADWIKAMDTEQMPWIQLADEFPIKNMPARVISRFKSGSIPLYVLVDPNGKILANTNNEEEVDAKLAEIFNK